MIKSLEVKDYALIEHITTEFSAGLNIITGETGAGKSILVDAMGLLLGERASNEVVRKGANKAIVEGIFKVDKNLKVKNVLAENDLEDFPELILRREISIKGANRCFVNDTPVPLSVFKELGNLLVDLHGQHEHQSLLRTETHINFLDEFGSYNELLLKYKSKYDLLINAQREIKSFKEREQSIKEKKEIYAFQIKEIDSLSPKEDEEEKLQGELNILENAEKLGELTNEIYDVLYESDSSVYDAVVKVKNDLVKLEQIDASFSEPLTEAESILALINDLTSFIQKYKVKANVDPASVEEVRERLGAISLLKKKYGGSVKAMMEHRNKIGLEFELAENFVDKIKEIENQFKVINKEALNIAQKISSKRNETSKKVKQGIESSLKELGINKPEFKVVINSSNSSFNVNGIDEVEFFISTNEGEDPKPLVKVASGGEVSRIMLSLKSVLAKNDKLPLLIFDEIDVGISGRIAQKVGSALKDLSKYHQIITITHLPQIAALADHHFLIHKTQKDARVISSIKKLQDSERITEVAKLLSGEKVTESSLKSARELVRIKE